MNNQEEVTVSVTEIANVVDGLMTVIEKERQKSVGYQNLFAKDDVEAVLREAEHKMMKVVLDAAAVLQDKHGFSFSRENGHKGNEAYGLLLSLPLLAHKLEKHITAKEGFSCSVDKAYYLLARVAKELGQPKHNR